MAPIIEAISFGLESIFSWPTFLFVLIGTLIGVIFGVLPGLGGVVALALIIPFTFGMDPTHAFALYGSAMGGVAFSGSVSAILINVPGGAPNAATMLDGYEMTKQGRAQEAISISAVASGLGAIFGLAVLILILPVAREVILAFGSSEFFWLAILGLTVIATASDGPLLKGLIAGGIGMMITFIGYSNFSLEYRYGFGTDYLWDGIPLVPALIGLFAIGEILRLGANQSIVSEDVPDLGGGTLKGIKHVLSKPFLLVRSSAIGTLLGMIPGVGGVIPPFISYSQAAQTSKHPETFGKGEPDGVLAPEAANDSKDGGQLLPTVVFGIPGGAQTAILLGGFTLHGLTPGREMLGEGLPLLFVLLAALLVSNVITSTLGLTLSRPLSNLVRLPATLLIPFILTISIVGAFAVRNNILDVWVALIFGIIGFLMVVLNYSRIAVVLALVLGSIAETSFHQAIAAGRGDVTVLFTRPISSVLFVLVIISLLIPVYRARRKTKARGVE